MNDGIYNIIDADTLVYLVAYKFRDSDDTTAAIRDLDDFVRTLLDNTSCSHYAGFIGGDKCFRYDIAKTKPYKSNRPPSPDWYKKWSGPFRAHLRDEWNFMVVNGIEADDAVCIYQTWCRENSKNSIMCHGDKDLYQIEGNHYDLRKHTRRYVSELEASQNLYKQVLTGDASDAIIGLRGCGKVSAAKLIDPLENKELMWKYTMMAFKEKHGDTDGTLLFHENFQLVYLLRHSETLPIQFHTYTPRSVLDEPGIDLTGLIWD